MAVGGFSRAPIRSATTLAWTRPFSARCRPGAFPGSIFPVVGVVPCRTSSTTVGAGPWAGERFDRGRAVAERLEPGRAGPERAGPERAEAERAEAERAEAERGDAGTGSHRRLCAVPSNRAPADSLTRVQSDVTDCHRCPRLVRWREGGGGHPGASLA